MEAGLPEKTGFSIGFSKSNKNIYNISMLDLARRYPGYLFFRQFGFPHLLPISLAISVTHRCNARCRTCRVTKKKPDELTLNEYVAVFKTLHRVPRWVTITGGEPFIRRDLSEISDALVRYVAPDAVTVATNAFFTDRIVSFARSAIRENPKTKFIVNLSLDGIGPAHDKIRGLPGSFERVMDVFRSLKDLELGNMRVGFHTVVSRFNLNSVSDLMEYTKVFEPDHHRFEIAQARAELNVKNEDLAPSAEEYERIVLQILERSVDTGGDLMSDAIELFRREYYEHSIEILHRKEQVLPCFAGFASAQIGPNGDVWPCCVLARPMGNLREKEYDFGSVWESNHADRLRAFIRENRCYCPMANAAYTNMLLHPGTIARVLTRRLTKK